MKFLCGISDWETNVATRGRGVGNTIIKRVAVGMDKWCIVIGIQRGGTDESPIFGECFVPSMRLLFPFIDEQVTLCQTNHKDLLTFMVNVKRDPAIRSVLDTLERLTGKKAPIVDLSTLKTRKDFEAYGKEVDYRFGTSFARDQVQKNVFGSEEEDEEGEVATSSTSSVAVLERKKAGRPRKIKV